jgi:fumarate hydratase subunit alpha/L(+)-tartrate dehydratase alpha subunit
MGRVALSAEFYRLVEETGKELYIRALKDLPPDVRSALAAALARETSGVARQVLGTMLEAVRIADEKRTLICQDTGIPLFFVRLGSGLGADPVEIERALVRGTERATREHPLRSSVCTPLSRVNPQTSTGFRIPVFHWEFTREHDDLEILMVPKGSGSENMSFLKMLIPADGIRGVKRFILETVLEIGANPCPPYILGVGLGGTADLCMKLAKLAAVTRPIGSRNPDPEMAALEEEILTAVNELGIGPMGLGGITTVLAVHIEHADTHITQNPVAINVQCWPARRARARLTADGKVEFGY